MAGRKQEADKEWDKALALDPKVAEPSTNFNDYRALQHLSQKWIDWTTLLNSSPDDYGKWDGYLELCLFLGREDEYRRVRRTILAKFSDTTDPSVAGRAGRSCLLIGGNDEETRQAVAMIDRALAADTSTFPSRLSIYFQLAKGLAEYRQGHLQNAITILQGNPSRLPEPAPKLIVAMAQRRLGQIQDAQRSLASADTLLDWTPDQATEGEAWACHVLRRQAEEMIRTPLPGRELTRFISNIKAGDNLEDNWTSWKSALLSDPADHENWSGFPELSVYLGHEDEYRSVRTRLLTKFGNTADPQVAERVGRACLLLPASEEETRQSAALIDRAIDIDKSTGGSWKSVYFRVAKGLAEYRQGRLNDTIELLKGGQVLQPAPQLILAMAQFRSGQRANARTSLNSAITMFDWNPARAVDADAWMFHILRREAEKLINGNAP
jgi:tetratricopeptide (TPR) repeat protein